MKLFTNIYEISYSENFFFKFVSERVAEICCPGE